MIRHHYRTTSAIALTLALAAFLAPVASADPPLVVPAGVAIAHVTTVAPASGATCGDVCSGHGYGSVAVPARSSVTPVSCGDLCSAGGYGSVPAPAAVRVLVPKDGFDWGDAAVGAGGALALTMLGLGGVTAVRRRGRRASIGPRASAHS